MLTSLLVLLKVRHKMRHCPTGSLTGKHPDNRVQKLANQLQTNTMILSASAIIT